MYIQYMWHTNHRREFLKLIQKYLNGESTEAELNFIKKYYAFFEKEEDVLDSLSERERIEIESRLESSIMEAISTGAVHPVRSLWKPLAFVAAAMVLIALSIGLYFNAVPNKGIEAEPMEKEVATDISPGGNKAVLTLADGSTISLDDAKEGDLVEQGGMKITKTEDGLVTYTTLAKQHTKDVHPQFNTISTPKGGQYRIVLPDGTTVWLNAASSLKYPTQFTGKERKVELIGEAYFEVSRKHSTEGNNIPFYVKTSVQTVEVLGTHFNVNAYSDEGSTNTTLLEGSVRIMAEVEGKVASILLKPGEQIKVNKNGIGVSTVNVDNFIAWKNGLFQFQDSDIQSVMRQFSRWYNVDVEFEGEMPSIKLWGKVYRDVNASEALEILEYFGFSYRIVQAGKSKKIIIS